jgi:hypothetical protein
VSIQFSPDWFFLMKITMFTAPVESIASPPMAIAFKKKIDPVDLTQKKPLPTAFPLARSMAN